MIRLCSLGTFPCFSSAVAVGTTLSGGPPHRSGRAENPHPAPASGRERQALVVGEYDTVNGVPGRGGALNGPRGTIAGGMLYVSYGIASFMPGNVLLAFALA